MDPTTPTGGDRRRTAAELMRGFTDATGVTSDREPRRYLWTDAFAVCNCLALASDEDDGAWLEAGLGLVDQVHQVLGRHRDDDPRVGWISGLDPEEGEAHPTAGGLRIGKPLPERGPGEPVDRRLEWDRDGQYYHYLTRWMHALGRVARVTGRADPLRWARELAAVTHEAFTHVPPGGGTRRIHWKMSIDLSRPLVPSMGAHDPLDGWVTFRTLQRAEPPPGGEPAPEPAPEPGSEAVSGGGPDLSAELEELAAICERMSWTTDDPLGIGGLLVALHRVMALAVAGDPEARARAPSLADAAVRSVELYRRSDPLRWPAENRLPFRELGLAIGLRGTAGLERLADLLPLADAVESFWLDPANRAASTWADHEEINTVMLATSLLPGGYLGPVGMPGEPQEGSAAARRRDP